MITKTQETCARRVLSLFLAALMTLGLFSATPETVLAASSDATLASLVVDSQTDGSRLTLNPAFNSNTFNYTAGVSNSVTAVQITASATDGFAMVTNRLRYRMERCRLCLTRALQAIMSASQTVLRVLQ